MKKYFMIAAAAIVAFSACSKTETTYLGEGQEIGFNAIQSVLTKAQSPADANLVLGVTAQVKGQQGGEPYFKNVKFSNKNVAGKPVWGATPAQYYPKGKELDFTMYAPHNDAVNVLPGKITYAVPADVDFLYGATLYTGPSKDGIIPVVLKHAKAKVTVNTKCNLDKLYTVNNVTFQNATTDGTITVDYAEPTTVEPTWEVQPAANLVLGTPKKLTTTDAPEFYAQSFVVPQGKIGTIVVDYTINGVQTTKEVTLTQPRAWERGKNYIFNLYLTTNEILFSVDVEDWADETPEDIHIKDEKEVVLP